MSEEYRRGYRDGFLDARDHPGVGLPRAVQTKDERRVSGSTSSPKPKRKASAYSKRYGAAFRKVAPRFKKKNGSWKVDGFKKAQKAAHKLARKD